MTRLVDEGLVAEDWKDNDTKGICTSSVVVFVVQKGNPKGIESWDDLVEPGVGIVTPNPASSGSAKWNLLAAYGAANDEGGSDEAAQEYMTKLFGNVAALPDSGRDATTAFTSGTGDVLLSYENEAILARQSGQDFDYVIPDETLLDREPVRAHRRTPRRRPRTSWTSRRAPRARSCTPRPATARSSTSATSRSTAPTTRATRTRSRPSCSPSTVTSVAGPRPTTKYFGDGDENRLASSPRSRPRPGSSEPCLLRPQVSQEAGRRECVGRPRGTP